MRLHVPHSQVPLPHLALPSPSLKHLTQGRLNSLAKQQEE
jgi:hypothetical protein